MKKSLLTHIIFLLACTSLSSRNDSSGGVVASDPDTLKVQWSYSIGCEDRGGPAVGPDGTIYVGGHSGYIHTVNPDGSEKWVRTDVVRRNSEEHPGSPVITDDGTLILGFRFSNRIVGLDAATGQTKWERKLADKTLELGTKAPPAVAPDCTILCLCRLQVSCYEGLQSTGQIILADNGRQQFQVGSYIRLLIYG
jgi:outer membrane protein assembly factor BamB